MANPRQELWRLSPLGEPEYRQLVVEPDGATPHYPADATLPVLFSDRVSRHPHRPAVRANGRTVTYRELDDRPHAIAARLAG